MFYSREHWRVFSWLSFTQYAVQQAMYASNIEQNKMKIRQAQQNIHQKIIFGLSGNYYFIQSRGQRRYEMKSFTGAVLTSEWTAYLFL
jgi:hypothetical protein